MRGLLIAFNQDLTSRNAIDATFIAYNKSCAEMRSDPRDAAIHFNITRIGAR